MGEEKNVDWYDEAFRDDQNYHVHYTRSRYYGLWKEVIEELKKIEDPIILDVGCGPGQFGAMLQDNGYFHYLGIDFSPFAIRLAISNSTQNYKCVDIWKYDFPDRYNTYILLECLEHIEDDLKLIDKIEKGKNIIATVPKFDGTSHVRHFQNKQQVIDRYGPSIDITEAVEFKHHRMISGIRNGD